MADVKDDKYIRAYDKQLRIGERKEIGAVRSYYQQQYIKGVDQFLKTGKTANFNDLFLASDLTGIYNSIYTNIGLRFANWYANNIDKYITKQLETNKYKDTWETAFAKEGNRVAATRVVTVSGTAKKELEKTLKKLMTDVDFQSVGADEKARILRNRFNKLGKYQAERIVRTEATNAANLGVMQSATDVYGKNGLQKKWITSIDGRERSAHAAANGQVVDFNDKFRVGGEMLDRAGDPAGSAANVVNCRCAIAPFPKAEAQTITPLTGFDYGMSAGRAIGLDSANAVDDILKPKPQPVREVVEETKPKAVIPDELQDKINKGWDVGDLSYLDNLVDDNINFRFATKRQASTSNYNHDRRQVTIVLGKRYTKKGKNLKEVLAHEYGHALHHSKGWITNKAKGRSYILDNDYDEDVIKHFKKQNQKINEIKNSNPNYFDNLIYPKGGDKYEETLNTYWKNFYKYEERISKKYNLTKEQYKRKWEAMHDYFGALTREQLGGGHGYFYYSDRGVFGQMAEIFANAHQFYYNENVVFKELYPEFYKDAIDYIQTMLNKL